MSPGMTARDNRRHSGARFLGGCVFFVQKRGRDAGDSYSDINQIRAHGGGGCADIYSDIINHCLVYPPYKVPRNYRHYIPRDRELPKDGHAREWSFDDIVDYFQYYKRDPNRVVLLQAEWLQECIDHNRYIGEDEDYGGWRVWGTRDPRYRWHRLPALAATTAQPPPESDKQDLNNTGQESPQPTVEQPQRVSEPLLDRISHTHGDSEVYVSALASRLAPLSATARSSTSMDAVLSPASAMARVPNWETRPSLPSTQSQPRLLQHVPNQAPLARAPIPLPPPPLSGAQIISAPSGSSTPSASGAPPTAPPSHFQPPIPPPNVQQHISSPVPPPHAPPPPTSSALVSSPSWPLPRPTGTLSQSPVREVFLKRSETPTESQVPSAKAVNSTVVKAEVPSATTSRPVSPTGKRTEPETVARAEDGTVGKAEKAVEPFPSPQRPQSPLFSPKSSPEIVLAALPAREESGTRESTLSELDDSLSTLSELEDSSDSSGMSPDVAHTRRATRLGRLQSRTEAQVQLFKAEPDNYPIAERPCQQCSERELVCHTIVARNSASACALCAHLHRSCSFVDNYPSPRSASQTVAQTAAQAAAQTATQTVPKTAPKIAPKNAPKIAPKSAAKSTPKNAPKAKGKAASTPQAKRKRGGETPADDAEAEAEASKASKVAKTSASPAPTQVPSKPKTQPPPLQPTTISPVLPQPDPLPTPPARITPLPLRPTAPPRARTPVQRKSAKNGSLIFVGPRHALSFHLLDISNPVIEMIISNCGGEMDSVQNASFIVVSDDPGSHIEVPTSRYACSRVVSVKWIWDCAKANHILDPTRYLVHANDGRDGTGRASASTAGAVHPPSSAVSYSSAGQDDAGHVDMAI